GGGLARAAAPAVVALALAAILSTPPPQPETFSNIPQTLSGGDGKQQVRIKRPKSAKALQCTSKCVATCIRGGEGPLNVRKPLVVFKGQFRSRQYCLAECSDVCNLIKDGEDGQ
ncbi:Os06g0704200, partial [Oryza sativa Japonica Group]